MKKQGFTLIELMIVVALIFIIAAIAIPNLLQSRMRANERVAFQRLVEIRLAQDAFAKSHSGEYATMFAELKLMSPGDLTQPFQGYTFLLNTTKDGYTVIATPVAIGRTGFRRFFLDESGIIRGNDQAEANVTSTPLTEASKK